MSGENGNKIELDCTSNVPVGHPDSIVEGDLTGFISKNGKISDKVIERVNLAIQKNPISK